MPGKKDKDVVDLNSDSDEALTVQDNPDLQKGNQPLPTSGAVAKPAGTNLRRLLGKAKDSLSLAQSLQGQNIASGDRKSVV